MPDVLMPRLSDSMEEATIIRWLKQEGEEVTAGDELVEIETDKATMVYEAEQSGPLHIVAAEGETVGLREVMATIGGGSGPEPAAAESAAATATAAAANGGGVNVALATPPVSAPSAPTTTASGTGSSGRVAATPIARRLAAELGIDLASMLGSGPRGRVVKRDVLAVRDGGGTATPAPAPAASPAPTPAAVAVAEPEAVAGDAEQSLSRVQQVIAERMAQSRSTVPDFEVSVTIDMEAAIALRQASLESSPEARFSFNDLIVKACASALRRHPRVNGSFAGDRFVLHDEVSIGIAVASDDALIVPVVHHADRKGLLEIAADSRRLAEAVRAGNVAPAELAGGTFTVSNLGMFGIDSFTAIVNAPQAAILAVGAMAPRVVAHEGEPAVRRCMTVTLCCDHRIIYGADAAKFVAELRDLLQTPVTMLL